MTTAHHMQPQSSCKEKHGLKHRHAKRQRLLLVAVAVVTAVAVVFSQGHDFFLRDCLSSQQLIHPSPGAASVSSTRSGGSNGSCQDVFSLENIMDRCQQRLGITNFTCDDFNTNHPKCLQWLSTTVGCDATVPTDGRGASPRPCRNWTPFHLIADVISEANATLIAASVVSILHTQRCPVVYLWIGPRKFIESRDALLNGVEAPVQPVLLKAVSTGVLKIVEVPGGDFRHSGVPTGYDRCAQVTPFAKLKLLYWSDCVPLQVLQLLGGVYLDTDLILLRDLGPLLDLERDLITPWGDKCKVENLPTGQLVPLFPARLRVSAAPAGRRLP